MVLPPVVEVPTETAVNTEVLMVVEKENQDESTMLEMPEQQPPPIEAPAMQDVVEEEHQDEPTTPEAEGCAAKGLMDSPDAMIIDVLLSINQGGPGPSTQPTNDDNQDLGDQCRTPDPLQQHDTTAPAKHELEARCAAWATLDNDNKYETIFQLRGPRTIKAMRYNFMTMRPANCIYIQMVSIMCHVLNRKPVQRFERDVYCVPPEILTRMFDTYGLSYLDKKTKMSYLVKQLKDHEEYVQLLDMDKLKSHSILFASALYSSHWWLYVLDVENKEFYIVDSVYGIAPNQMRNKLHRFACNVLNQSRVWAGVPSILMKGTIALQLRCMDVPKQPNPTDCGIYVMKWMELLDAAMLSDCYQFKVRYKLEEWGQDRLDGFRAEIVAKLTLSDENTLRVEAVNQANKMGRQTRPSAALKSPYVHVSTAEIDKHH
ncbi:hypothetical protein PIB30_095087 [Stylosanthes scabra]|uniref:Ubiquitin-like protease family profile domain-containing protein n=1 Tax=Stylosanthes scabra TaxID=79078 RepID=A0ABU6VU24_9FABA|nr:hypothetical protein [Stylosanthes scabra]